MHTAHLYYSPTHACPLHHAYTHFIILVPICHTCPPPPLLWMPPSPHKPPSPCISTFTMQAPLFVKTCNHLKQFVIIKDSVLTYKIIYCKNHKMMLLIQSLNQEWTFELIYNLLSYKCSTSHHLTIVLRLHFHCSLSISTVINWYRVMNCNTIQVHDTDSRHFAMQAPLLPCMLPCHTWTPPPPPPTVADRMAHACENNTFRLAGGNNGSD